MTVALLMMTCSLFGAVLMTLHFTANTGLGFFGKGAVLSLFLASFFAPLLTFDRSGHGSGPLYSLYYHTLYTLFVTAYILLMVLILREVAWKTAYWFSPPDGLFRNALSPKNTLLMRRADLATLAFAAAFGLYALFCGMRVPPVRTVTLRSAKITSPVSLVVLGDLHLHRTLPLSKLRGIVDRTAALNPDLVLLPGDTIDDDASRIEPHLALLGQLRARHGVYAVAGNHELYVGRKMSEQAIRGTGITWLYNSGLLLTPDLYLAGVPYRGTSGTAYDRAAKVDYKRALANRPAEAPHPYTILLAHTPKEAKHIPEGAADLQIAGHTHGGQIFPFHLISWRLNDYFLAGLYTIGDLSLYVTRGSGQWGPQLRLFAPSEITHIRLEPEAN